MKRLNLSFHSASFTRATFWAHAWLSYSWPENNARKFLLRGHWPRSAAASAPGRVVRAGRMQMKTGILVMESTMATESILMTSAATLARIITDTVRRAALLLSRHLRGAHAEISFLLKELMESVRFPHSVFTDSPWPLKRLNLHEVFRRIH